MQTVPLTFELASPATTLGARHGLIILGAQQYYSGGCLVSEITVKGGMLFERVLIYYPKFSSWSLIPTSLGRCFHAISFR